MPNSYGPNPSEDRFPGFRRSPPHSPPPPVPNNKASAPFCHQQQGDYAYSYIGNAMDPAFRPQHSRTASNLNRLSRNVSKNGNEFRRKLYNRRNGSMFRLSMAGTIISALLLMAGIWCFKETESHCSPFHSAIWTAALLLLNSGIGLAAAKTDSTNFYVAHLVFSLISLLFCPVGAYLSLNNWLLFGTNSNITDFTCLIEQFNYTKLLWIHETKRTYDFSECVFNLKMGLLMSSSQFLFSVVLGVLFLHSFLLCLLRTCTSFGDARTAAHNRNGHEMTERH